MKTQLLIPFLFLATACIDIDLGDDGRTDDGLAETGDTGEPGQPLEPTIWEEIECIEIDVGMRRCMGRPEGSADAWVIVHHDCELDALVTSLDATEVNTWQADSCASGLSPDNYMPYYRCLWLADTSTSVCYSGDGQWWTPIDPLCESASVGTEYWPTWMCDGEAGMIGATPWDAAACPNPLATACNGYDDLDVMALWPTCWVDGFTSTTQPECI